MKDILLILLYDESCHNFSIAGELHSTTRCYNVGREWW